MTKDNLEKPIEYLCATMSFESLQKLLQVLKEPANIASVCDELYMRLTSELYEVCYGIPEDNSSTDD